MPLVLIRSGPLFLPSDLLFFFPLLQETSDHRRLDAGGFGKGKSHLVAPSAVAGLRSGRDRTSTSRPGDEEGAMHAGAWEVATGAREVAGAGAMYIRTIYIYF
jgi:hypothetical protein